MAPRNRWLVALAGVIMQMALGAVYAWSVFRTPLVTEFGWTIREVTLTFTITIFMLGMSAFPGGLWLNRRGPRVVAMTGGLLYGSGVLLASFTGSLFWLYLTYGVIGGVGLGFGYIVPVAVLVKWFPDKRGFITGVAVGGFGAGALVTAPIATRLIESVGVLQTFAWLGAAYLVLVPAAGWFLTNPPPGWKPEGWTPAAAAARTARDFSLAEALRTPQWWMLWLVLFLNVSAGIALISQQAPMFQELAGVSAIGAASMVGIVSIGNAVGRVFWAALSDLLTRKVTFLAIFATQVALFWYLPEISSPTLLTVVAFVILMCYGGGFGTMPAWVADFFGTANVGPIYGLMLTAWGFASVFGPQLIAQMRQTSGTYSGALHVIAIVMAVSMLLPALIRSRQAEKVSV